MLRILDKESASLAKRTLLKKKKAVSNARKRMGASKDQPSIMDIMKRKSSATLDQGLTCSTRSGWKSSQGAATSGVSGGRRGRQHADWLCGGGSSTEQHLNI